MNLSGRSVAAARARWGFSNGQILVVHDDLDLPVGRVKVVRSGGAAGHRGVQSVIVHLGNNGFPRVKVGIGRPRYGERVEEYVLAPFYEDESAVVEQAVRLAVRACGLFLINGVEAAMNAINSQNLFIKEEKS